MIGLSQHPDQASPRPTAAVFSTNFLDFSQSFILEELRQHRRWQAEVFCARRRNAAQFPFDLVHRAGPIYPITQWDLGFDRLFRAGRFSIIHGHFGTGSLYALSYARRFRLPLVTTFHGYDVPLLKSDRRLHPTYWRYALLAPALIRRVSLALCASNELREMVVEYGVPGDRAVVHRLGVDLDRFRPTSRPPDDRVLQMVQIGRFVEKKGFRITLAAFSRFLARGGSAHLTLVGGGDRQEEAALRRLVADLGIVPQVTFAGVLSQQQVTARLAESHLVVCPSVTAGNGDRESGVIVIKEAAACGIPAIATWHGGIPEIVEDGVTGLLVPERAVEALADGMERVASDASLRMAMGRAARSKMEREYDNRIVVARLEDHYDEVVARWRREQTP